MEELDIQEKVIDILQVASIMLQGLSDEDREKVWVALKEKI